MQRKLLHNDESLSVSLVRYQHSLMKTTPFTLMDLHQLRQVNRLDTFPQDTGAS